VNGTPGLFLNGVRQPGDFDEQALIARLKAVPSTSQSS
jgi:hypothetical protein